MRNVKGTRTKTPIRYAREKDTEKREREREREKERGERERERKREQQIIKKLKSIHTSLVK